MTGPRPKQQISKERLDRLLFNPGLSHAVLEDCRYSRDHKAAKEAGSTPKTRWIAYAPSAGAKRAEILLVPPNGRICGVKDDAVVPIGAIDVYRRHHSLTFVEAVIRLEARYLGQYGISSAEVVRNQKLPTECRLAAAEDGGKRSQASVADQPSLQPGAREKLTPEEALRQARQRFASAVPDPGTGYLVTRRHIDPAIVRRFGADLGRWATLRYDEARDEVLIAHLDADERFVGYEYRGGVTPMNRRGSRGYAAHCSIGLAVLGNLATATRLVMTESGIEALSLCELEGDASQSAVYVSCSGGPKAGQPERVARWATQTGGTVVLAYNADRAGANFRRSASEALTRLGVAPTQIHNLLPTEGADWNIALQAAKGVGNGV